MTEIAAGKTVTLRDSIPSDLELHLRWLTGGEWLAYDAPWETRTRPTTDEEMAVFRRRFLQSCEDRGNAPRQRATIVARDGPPIGWVNRYPNERFPRACHVGIDICEDSYLNAGHGTEALGLWVGYLFAVAGFHRIGLETWSLNPRMCRVAEKLGFTLEGAERELAEWKGKWHDRLRFGVLRSEWERRQRSHP